MTKNIFFTRRVNKHRGKYIAVADNKIIASAQNAREAFRLARQARGQKKVDAIYYIPGKKDILTALCASRTKNSRRSVSPRSSRST